MCPSRLTSANEQCPIALIRLSSIAWFKEGYGNSHMYSGQTVITCCQFFALPLHPDLRLQCFDRLEQSHHLSPREHANHRQLVFYLTQHLDYHWHSADPD